MKKKLAVLMAAATVATTVAPTLANADTTKYSNQSLENLVDAAKKALAEKFANNNTGLTYEDNSNLKDWQKSRYAVLLKVENTTANLAPAEPTDKDLFEAYKGADTTYTTANLPVKGLAASADGTAVYAVKSGEGLYNFLEKASVSDKSKVTLYVVDKGVNDADKKSTREATNKVIDTAVRENTVRLSEQLNDLVAQKNSVAKSSAIGKKYVKLVNYTLSDGSVHSINAEQATNVDLGTNSVEKVEVVLYNGTKLVLANGADALDFTKPVDDGNNEVLAVVDADGTVHELESSVAGRVVGFKKLETAEEGQKVVADINFGDTMVYELNPAVEKNYTLPTFYTSENGYTEAGADFVNNFVHFNQTANGKKLNLDGTSYLLNKKNANNALVKVSSADYTITKNKDGKYLLQVVVPVVDANDTQRVSTLLLNFTSDNHADLADFAKALVGDNEVVAGKFKRLVGDDRYQTAIEVSKEAFDGKNGHYADTVVITGGTALLDGLSAAPLASAHNASILLASPRSGLSQATLDEIGRVTDNKLYKKTVYVVGGYNSVPASVDKVLADKFGAVVVRLAGDDRYATSKQVAERLVYDNKVNGNVFYVGGKGAPDAMSAAPVAATKNNAGKVAPILVTKDKDLDQQTRNFLLNKVLADNGKSYVVGGMNTLGTAFYKDAVAIKKNGTVERISGADRYATNVKVLDKFYNVGGRIDTQGLFVASGMTKYLVDAQTSGALAAAKNAPILLAGSKLTDDQTALLKKPTTGTEATAFYGYSNNKFQDLSNTIKGNVYQVGGVVSADAMKTVVDKFDL